MAGLSCGVPKHAVRRGGQTKLRRGSKRAFFACVGGEGSAGSELRNIDRFAEPTAPLVGGFGVSRACCCARSPPVKPSATVPQKLPALKGKCPSGDCKQLKPLANCCLFRLSCLLSNHWLMSGCGNESAPAVRNIPQARAWQGRWRYRPFVADRVGQHHDDVLRRAFVVASGSVVRNIKISAFPALRLAIRIHRRRRASSPWCCSLLAAEDGAHGRRGGRP